MATPKPTQKPVPSSELKDLLFNAGKTDEFVTSEQHDYVDRFGIRHRTLEGINYDARQAMLKYGYITKKSFEEGATLDTPNTVLQWRLNGEFYRWDGDWSRPKVVPAGSTPESTGGIGQGKWVGIGDTALRNELHSPSGSSFVYFLYANGVIRPRTVQSKLRDNLSILDFVTESDNNHSPVLQRALDYVASLPMANRPEIHVPSTIEYKFKERVIWPVDENNALQDIALVGDFITNTRSNGTSKFTFEGADSIFIDLRKGNNTETTGGIRITGLSFYGKAGQTAINGWNTVASVFEDLSFGGFSLGLNIPHWLYYCKIDNCNCFGLRECGMNLGLLNGTTVFRSRFNKIDPLGSINGQGRCIKIKGGGFGGKLVGCWFEDTRVAIDVATTDMLEITGCYIEGVIYPIYSSDIAGQVSRIRMNNTVHTMWHHNSRLAISENGGQLIVDVHGHRTTGGEGLVNTTFGLQANGGTILMDIVDYRPLKGTPLQKSGYTAMAPDSSGVVDDHGNLKHYVQGQLIRYATKTRDISYVAQAQIDNTTLVKKTSDTRKVQYSHNAKTVSLTFNLPSSTAESRLITASIRATFGSGGRAQRFWRGVLMIQSQAGSADIRALLTDTFTSDSLDERSLTRTISSVTPAIDISGANAVLSFTLTSGGGEAPFNMTGIFDITVVNDTALYPLQ